MRYLSTLFMFEALILIFSRNSSAEDDFSDNKTFSTIANRNESILKSSPDRNQREINRSFKRRIVAEQFQKYYRLIQPQCFKAITKSVEDSGKCGKQSESTYYHPMLETCQNCPIKCSADDNICAGKCWGYQMAMKLRKEMKHNEAEQDFLEAELMSRISDLEQFAKVLLVFLVLLGISTAEFAGYVFWKFQQQRRKIESRSHQPLGDYYAAALGEENGLESRVELVSPG